MGAAPRMTIATQLVLQYFLEEAGREAYGYQIGEGVGLATGTVHPILMRLESRAWLRSWWEEVDPSEAGRPARRYYALTPEGVQAATAALRAARRPRVGRALPAPGLS